ncbi:required for 18S rRNA maturation and 40 [Tubulinosema ratisbonensis]|uniref:Required for 18S rRNA maturation and 40 n=1 Tax=Tubulinosema ratisbonensis TaxID=291195 RepID=A0A437AM76_9MICR|nr:required for 18S rRNA maturation and 40 [Tubulinosema ratisbonensis]
MLTVILLKSHISDPSKKKSKPKQSKERLDITHQCILALIDSPACKSGNLRILIQTVENVLLEINPIMRVPRTLERFLGLFPKLFKERKIMNEKKEYLIRILKNDLRENMNPGTLKIGLSKDGNKIDKSLFVNKDITIFLNADQNSEDVFEEEEMRVKLSDFDLSAFVCCVKICSLYEEANDIF